MKTVITLAILAGLTQAASAQTYFQPYIMPQTYNSPHQSQPSYQPPTTYQNMGNFTYGSDGTTTQRMGNFSYTTAPDGRNITCQTMGQQTVCN